MNNILRRFRKVVRFFVPVVSSDARKIIEAIANQLPAHEGKVLLDQIEYVEGQPVRQNRSIQYRVSKEAPSLVGFRGMQKFAVVEMCYYQQMMTFTVFLNDGRIIKIESGEPEPLEKPVDEYSVLRVSILDA